MTKNRKKTKPTKENVEALLKKKSYKNLNAWRMDNPQTYGWAKTDLDYWAVLIDKYFK